MDSPGAIGWRRPLLAALFVLLTIISVTPIRSYDFFWHLATGRWIAEHKALPAADPFSVSSDDVRWIDGEWLFQLAASGVETIGGETAISIVRGLLVAAIFTIVFAVASKRADPPVALVATAIGLYGADHRLTARPESVATLLLVATLPLMFREVTARRAILFMLGCVIWINVHPSALLAPALAGIAAVAALLAGTESRASIVKRFGVAALGGVSLLANPYGLEGIVAPLRLARLAGSGKFVNMEWTASRLADFPLLYATAAVGIALAALDPLRRQRLVNLVLFAFLGALAFRYVRNQGFFFAAMPFLLAPSLPAVASARLRPMVSGCSALVLAAVLVRHGGVRTGVDETQFPVASVAYLKSLGLAGNIYNPDQLGGYLIWSVYPERRVLTDGRNELHRAFIDDYATARLDERAWRALIAKYRLTIAVDEYHRETMEVIDPSNGSKRQLPASLIYFPRSRWALIAFDDVGIVFLWRDAYDPALVAKLELRTLVPDGAVPLVDTSPETIALAREEIRRARTRCGSVEAIERIARGLGE